MIHLKDLDASLELLKAIGVGVKTGYQDDQWVK
jgi:hypothetical protein